MQKACRFCLIGAKWFKAGKDAFLNHTPINKVHKVMVIATYIEFSSYSSYSHSFFECIVYKMIPKSPYHHKCFGKLCKLLVKVWETCIYLTWQHYDK